MRELAWHYTTGEIFKKVVASGMLLPATAYIERREQPILWFSLEQFWEPTAQKAWEQNDGKVVLLGMKGTYVKGRGLARFGISPFRLAPWPQLAKQANIAFSIKRRLERVGREQGAAPELWCGMVGKPIPLEQIEAIEVFNGETWVRVRHLAAEHLAPYNAKQAGPESTDTHKVKSA